MAIQTRQITGPIETPEHEVVSTGTLRISLLFPIAEDTTFIAPFKIEYTITDGDLPGTAKLATPGLYEFRIFDYAEQKVYSFQQEVYPNSGSAISIAELWLMSRFSDATCGSDLENVDAALLGSDGATAGYVLTADGSGGTDWLPIEGSGLGDMLKSIYDTNDDGCVDCADSAATADLALDADRLGGELPSYYQEALSDAINEGAILTWNAGSSTYTPNENFVVDASGNITAGGIKLVGALFGNIYIMDIVYYLVDEETHVIVIKEDDVELRLPDPVTNDGRIIEIKKASSDGFDVSVTSAGGGTIEGLATYTLANKYDAITVVSGNGEWFIF